MSYSLESHLGSSANTKLVDNLTKTYNYLESQGH